MPNYLETFRKKTADTTCLTKSKMAMINSASGTTEVILLRNNKKITVNLVLSDNKEGRGTAIIYCTPVDGVVIGDYIRWKDYVYLITKKEKNILLHSTVEKFTARECNVKFKFRPKNDLIPLPEKERYGVFIGTTVSKLTENYKWINSVPLASAARNNLLIFSELEDMENYDIIKIEDETWALLETDHLTAKPIVFATVRHIAAADKFENQIPIFTDEYHTDATYEFATEDFYFKSSDVQPVKRTETSVTIRMPKKETITFEIKENGYFVEKTIKIV